MEHLFEISTILTVVGGAVATFFQSFKFVHEGERGIKLRFGKSMTEPDGTPRVIEPGFVLMIPWVESLQRRHVRQQTLRFDRQRAMLKNGLIFEISAVVIFRVKDVYKAMFEILNLEDSIEDLSMGILRDQLSKLDHQSIVATESISRALLEELQGKADEWGVDFIDFKITHCAPTPESATLVNARAGAKLKVEALADAVALNNNDSAINGMDPNLAAVLLGFPLVASSATTANSDKTLSELTVAIRELAAHADDEH